MKSVHVAFRLMPSIDARWGGGRERALHPLAPVTSPLQTWLVCNKAIDALFSLFLPPSLGFSSVWHTTNISARKYIYNYLKILIHLLSLTLIFFLFPPFSLSGSFSWTIPARIVNSDWNSNNYMDQFVLMYACVETVFVCWWLFPLGSWRLGPTSGI